MVLGAGVVGLACAHHLRKRGHSVTLVDADGAGMRTSFGNAGSISVGNVLPQSTPGIVAKGLRMLAEPLAPLKMDRPLRPGYWRWLWEFARAGSHAHISPIIDAMHAINHASRRAWIDWASDIEASELLAETGYLQVFERADTYARSEFECAHMRRLGVRFERLDRRGIEELEPQLGSGFEHAIFQPDAMAMRDPGGFCQRAAAHLAEHHAPILPMAIERISAHSNGYRLHAAERVLDCQRVVVCAGAWSVRLLHAFDVRLPIVPARGYHLMFDVPTAPVQRPTLWAERYMVVSPMNAGVRMTSIKELTRLDSDPHYSLVHRLRPELARLFPSLAQAPASEWAGLRPCTPDSLPIIDRLPGESIYIAAGHGHLGLTQAAMTGRLIGEKLSDETTAIDLTPFRLARFTREP